MIRRGIVQEPRPRQQVPRLATVATADQLQVKEKVARRIPQLRERETNLLGV
jgi:hypothetical protein